MQTDILIVGSGCSGLYCALHLPRDKKITIITKADAESNDSFLAQGGICVLRDEDDFDSFFEDTLKAGHYENDRESVRIMISSSRDVISDLVGYGVEFSRDANGEFNYTREGAHSKNRILFHRDITGKEITSKLLAEVKRRDNITILESTTLLDIIEKNGECVGAVITTKDGRVDTVSAEYIVLACGGIGGLYRHSTNFRHLTGDAIAIAIEHGVELKNINYIQIHPTTLYTDKPSDRSFLISESVRGEGAKLYNKDMERFANELLPRDLLVKEVKSQMKKDGTDFVWEDLRTIPEEELFEHFPNIVEHCKEQNYDVTEECIPVVPAQHYFMGGIKVDYNSKTSMDGLYAIGETACNGVHGRNRLASNSLLESLVFAKRAAFDMTENPREVSELPQISLDKYENREELKEKYRKLVLDEIEKANNEGDKKNV
ncbi:MAG: L-aspartate oxidase [Eubacteriales bacterium]|nr:L-aspartate oxidase [Eubacteriales bacterium]